MLPVPPPVVNTKWGTGVWRTNADDVHDCRLSEPYSKGDSTLIVRLGGIGAILTVDKVELRQKLSEEPVARRL